MRSLYVYKHFHIVSTQFFTLLTLKKKKKSVHISIITHYNISNTQIYICEESVKSETSYFCTKSGNPSICTFIHNSADLSNASYPIVAWNITFEVTIPKITQKTGGFHILSKGET